MNNFIKALILSALITTQAYAAQQPVINGETMAQARVKINANDAESYAKDATQDTAIGLNTAKVSFDSTSSTRLANTSGTNTGDNSGTDNQTIDALSLGGTTLSISLEGDGEAAQTVDLSSLQDGTGTDDQTSLEVTVTSSGFDGNLATTDNTVQKVAQKLDDLSISGGSALEALDEGVSLDTAVESIDFLGAGITAVEATDHNITVTVAAGSAPIATVNGQTGTVVLDADDISDSSTTKKFATAAELSAIATNSTKTGVTVEEQNVQVDWNSSSGDTQILNKPTIPTNNNQLTNGAGYIVTQTDDQTAPEVTVTVSGFGNNLSAADNTVQKALDTLDNMSTGGSMTYPGAGIPLSTGSAWGTSYTLDTDLSSVSASDDTLPSAKATKTALDLKASLINGGLLLDDLTKIKVKTTAEPTNGENLVDGTVGYGDADDDLRVPTVESMGALLAAKAPLNSPTLITPNVGTPSAGTLTNATGLPISTGVSGLGTGNATALAVNQGSEGGFGKIVAIGTQALGTSSIADAACATTIAISESGVAAGDGVQLTFTTSPLAVLGYGYGSNKGLEVYTWATSTYVNIAVCNDSGGAIVPGAISVKYQVIK